jgi:hypothetical protein
MWIQQMVILDLIYTTRSFRMSESDWTESIKQDVFEEELTDVEQYEEFLDGETGIITEEDLKIDIEVDLGDL